MDLQNGFLRRKTLVVSLKNPLGENAPGFPKEFEITSAFESGGNTFGELSNSAFDELSDADYATRLQAFMLYVESQISGLNSQNYEYTAGEEPYEFDAVSCPIGTPA